MIKIIAILISLASGAVCSYYAFYVNNPNIWLTILVGLGFFVATLVAIVALFFIIVFILGMFESMTKVRKYQRKFYRRALIFFEYVVLALFGVKRHNKGKELINPMENYIFIGNHRSNIDSAILDLYLKNKPLVFIAKKSLFKIPFMRKLIHGSAYIPMERGNMLKEFEVYKTAEDMLTRLDRGNSVGIFAEGTRNHSWDNKNVQEFKPGVFRLALKTHKPIAIFALRGTKEVNKGLLTKRHHVYCDIIEVIKYSTYKNWDVNQIAAYCHDKIENFLKENV